MPLTKLDTTAALVVIDLQKIMLGMPTVHPIAEIITRSSELARAFRAHGLPVVLVNATGMAPGRTDTPRPKMSLPDGWTELLPELEAQAGDILITKERWGAFLGTSLDEVLRQRGVTQIVLTGVATSIGVESTARSAYDLGYNVALVLDAMTDRDEAAHQYSVEKIFPRLGECDTTANVMKLLK